MNGESLNITRNNLWKLQMLFPDIFSEGEIDMEKFKATFSDDINFQNERYVLNWAGKADAFKVLQIPTTATLKPQSDQSIDFDTTQNVFIEGENLEVLKVLQKAYYGKVKCIIIDPPYNTGNDSFIYPDSFKENKAEYEKRIGDKDEEGYLMKEGMFRKNSKDSGHYHSNWLSMMYPRLFLAKNLLTDDGVIFVHIDDNEVHNLRLLMNEIFGEENFISELVWKKRVSPANDSQWFSSDHEYILVFAKYKEKWSPYRLARNEKQNSYYTNPDNDKRGAWNSAAYTCNKSKDERPNLYYALINPTTGEEVWPKATAVWAYSKETHEKHVKENILYWGGDGKSKSPRKKQFLTEAKNVVPRSILDYTEVGSTQSATLDFLKIFEHNYFNYTKPTELIKRLVNLSTESDDIILDFFAGSGTTAQAVLELNKEDGAIRKFLLVQLPELCDEKSEAFKAGFKTIADISKERIRRIITNINHRKEHLKKGLENDKSVVSEFEKKLAGLKKKSPQLFETEKGNPEIENINKQIEQILLKIKRYEEELHLIENVDKGFKCYKLATSNFKIWRGNEITEENLVTQLDAFTNPVKEESKTDNMLFELMLKAGYLLTDKVESKGKYYSVNDGELIIALEELNQKIIDSIIAAQPKKIITLDNLFTGNDQLKTNTVLQMKDAGIYFKTI